MLEHGGRLRRAAQQYGIALGDWLDLSTGISPWSWLDDRACAIEVRHWSRLPEDEDGLEAAAQRYYGAAALAVAGSQAAIQMLPRLRAPSRVGVLRPCYAEHAQAWRQAGHAVAALPREVLLEQIDALDVVVLAHPNNPDGQRYTRDELLTLHARLEARGGWLLLDEAFVDAEPDASLAADAHRPGLIVLRSLGKFFGLAGARVGFVLAEASLRARLRDMLGPWPLSGPARLIATQALDDRDWQRTQGARLQGASAELAQALRDAGLAPDGGCALFQWLRHPQAAALHETLASLGVLTRLCDDGASLRFGLPRDARELERLRVALRPSSGAVRHLLPQAGEGRNHQAPRPPAAEGFGVRA